MDAAGPVDFDPTQIETLARLLPAARLQTIVESYLSGARERLERIELHAAALDFGGLVREAHDLKSTAGNFGARKLQHLAEAMENAAKDEDAATVADLARQISAASPVAWELVRDRLAA